MDKSSKKRRLPNPPKTSEDYPFDLLTELEKRKKRSNILVPLGLAYLLWKWSEPYEERDRWEERYKRRKVKVKHHSEKYVKDRELKPGFSFTNLKATDIINDGKQDYTVVSVGADGAYIKDFLGKEKYITSLKGFQPGKNKPKSRVTIKESDLDRVVATLLEKGWDEKRIKAYLIRKAGTWALPSNVSVYDELKAILENIKDKYWDELGDDEFYDGIDQALIRLEDLRKEHMTNKPETFE